jgi:hypothetical protein
VLLAQDGMVKVKEAAGSWLTNIVPVAIGLTQGPVVLIV